jgi:hypothetical protein
MAERKTVTKAARKNAVAQTSSETTKGTAISSTQV